MELHYSLLEVCRRTLLLATTPVEPALRAQTAAWLLRQEPEARAAVFLAWEGEQPCLYTVSGRCSLSGFLAAAAWLGWAEDQPFGHTAERTLRLGGSSFTVACAATEVPTCRLVTVTLPPLSPEERSFPVSDGAVPLQTAALPGVRCLLAAAGSIDRSSAREILPYWAASLPEESAELLLWNEGARALDVLRYEKSAAAAVWESVSFTGAAAAAACLTARQGADLCLSLRQEEGVLAASSRWDGAAAAVSLTAPVMRRKEKTADVVF